MMSLVYLDISIFTFAVPSQEYLAKKKIFNFPLMCFILITRFYVEHLGPDFFLDTFFLI